jgi:hypothetical protein
MNLASKIFKNNSTGEMVKVIDSFENIAILENKQKIDTRLLLDSNQWTEQVDPSSFFNNQSAYNFLAEKIKNIPTNMLADDDENVVRVNPYNGSDFGPVSNESAIIMSSEDDERAELARKYGTQLDNQSSLNKQNESFSKLLGEDSDDLPQIPKKFIDEEPIQRVEVRREEIQSKTEVEKAIEVKSDPILTMFSKTKRNVEFKINVEILDRIPRLDFIEMMEDSYETSIIDYLADEFTNKILQDPSIIRDSIKNKIKQLVYGSTIGEVNSQNTYKKQVSFEDETGEVKVNTGKKTTPKTTPKTTTNRKPRAKKEESIEK